jgi:dipeptidyl aminopeptidase/acylaminoacyl peptidase
MVKRHHVAGVASAVLIALATPAEGAGRPFRFDELAKVERIGGFDLSPDGRWIAYAVGTPIVAENRVSSAIWLAPAGEGAPRRLTTGDKRDSDPRFSPDGRRVAFLSNRDGSSQVWTVDLAGGEPAKATSFPVDVSGFQFSPDGKWFLIASEAFPDCADTACLDARVKARAKSPTKARATERLLFRHWDSWKEEDPRRGRGCRGPDARGPRRPAVLGGRIARLRRLAGRQGFRVRDEPGRGRGGLHEPGHLSAPLRRGR